MEVSLSLSLSLSLYIYRGISIVGVHSQFEIVVFEKFSISYKIKENNNHVTTPPNPLLPSTSTSNLH
jgi:hypothetical protein